MPHGALTASTTRRAGLAAGIALLAAPALGQGHDGAWRRVLALGRIRFAGTLWMAQLPRFAGPAPEPVQDPFHAALAAHLAGALGLRHSFDPPTRAFEALRRLQQGQADVALGPMLNRLTAREMMFAPPYAELETVVLSADPARRRRLADWRGQRLGLLEAFVPHLSNLGFDLEDADLQTFAALPELEAALLGGGVHGAITTNITARNLMTRHPWRGLAPRTALTTHLHGAAVRFGEHELLRALAAALGEAAEQGILARLFEQYTGARLARAIWEP